MYHDDFGFDALAMPGPLDRPARPGGSWALDQDYAGNLVGLLLASDLFSARGAGPRAAVEGALLATSWPGTEVRYTGERLDQDDLDTYLGCLLLAFGNPGHGPGSTRFHLRDLIRRLPLKGRRLTVRGLERSLWRLAAAGIVIESLDGRVRAQTRLFHALLYDNDTGMCSVEINPRIMDGFRSPTCLERLLTTRAPLGAAPFRRWLACLLANSTACLRLELAGLRRLSGLGHQPMAVFRERADDAFQALSHLGYIDSIEPNGPDRLVVTHQVARGEQSACLLVS